VKPRICLNMIVRNEAAIIERALASVLPVIACYVILDTGSSDDTVARIRQFFDAAGVPGEVHHGHFANFSQARNDALDCCRASSLDFDYVLLSDADMQLGIVDATALAELNAAAYLVRQRNVISYFNVRLVRRDVNARYVGVTHEYVDLDGHQAEQLLAIEFIDHADGANRPQKAARDIALLSEFLKAHPGDGRSLFYLAQSYRDAGRLADAIAAYGQRIAAGGWEEEVWYAQYQLALCQRDIGNRPAFVTSCLAAYQRRPSRAEPLYALAQHYREQNEGTTALLFAEAAVCIPYPASDTLFIDEFVYQTGCLEELAISGYYGAQPAQRRKGAVACNTLALRRDTPQAHRTLARNNLLYYAQSARELFADARLLTLAASLPPPYAAMNPSVALADDGLHVLLRGVNYTVDANGGYVIQDTAGVVRTRNYLARLDASLQMTQPAAIADETNRRMADNATIVGFEDCRLFRWRNEWWASATVRDQDAAMRAQMVLLQLDHRGAVRRCLTLHGHGAQTHEKNWMPCVRGDELLFVYSCDPLVVLKVTQLDDQTARVELLNEWTPSAAVDHLRGGSQLLWFDGGWLAVTHEVVHIGSSRHYLHRMIWLDADYQLRRITMPFFFLHEGIEFVAGLARAPSRDSVVISFGVRDAVAHVAEITTAAVRAALEAV
jgi:glycosyltransferase involved in cell wall biosynthesis